MPDKSSQKPQRRELLKAAAGGLLILKPAIAFGTQANSAVEIGLIGCGGRGNWIAPFFPEFAGARIVALADVVKEHLDSTRASLKVEESGAYYGPDAYKDLANSKLDAVVIETPPYYHPEHAEAAVQAGKHVFVAKPVAVDVPGCRSILASGKKAAQADRSFLVDFQTRAMPVFQEAAERVHRGDIGKPAFAQVVYYAGRPSPDKTLPGMDPEQARLFNFYMDRTLGGDIIVEQNIHVIDVANWLLQGHPLRANGTGGRTDWSGTKYNTGDAWDHFAVTFWYPDGVHASFSSNQLTNSYSDLCVRCFGVNGCADTHYGWAGANHRRQTLERRREGRYVPAGRDQQCEGVHREHTDGKAGEQRRAGRGEQPHRDPGPDGRLFATHCDLGRDAEVEREIRSASQAEVVGAGSPGAR